MAWTDTAWSQDGTKNGGYPYVNSCNLPAVADMSGVYSVWTISSGVSGGYPYINTASLPDGPGAFRYAKYLYDVTIPPTVKTIGQFAFADTMLDIVRISANCTRYDTSFPQGCEVWHYTENSNLVDSNGMYMVDCNGFLLATTETEG